MSRRNKRPPEDGVRAVFRGSLDRFVQKPENMDRIRCSAIDMRATLEIFAVTAGIVPPTTVSEWIELMCEVAVAGNAFEQEHN